MYKAESIASSIDNIPFFQEICLVYKVYKYMTFINTLRNLGQVVLSTTVVILIEVVCDILVKFCWLLS